MDTGTDAAGRDTLILEGVRHGLHAGEIAQLLHYYRDYVKHRIRVIMRRQELHTRAQPGMWLGERGLERVPYRADEQWSEGDEP